ncbi:MAG: MFS transporter [Lentisphaerae bacterium]|jgi:MFS transporter, PPP family, 3-phenylpropionic acid transporter|nr:MFS transporter [Lentisphaerota bacterium]
MWALRGAMFLILLGCGIVWVYAGVWMRNVLGEAAIGLLMGFGGAFSALMAMFWGWLSDHTGRSTPIVCAGCLLTGVGLITLSQSQTVPGFILSQALLASGISATMTMMPLLALALLGGRKQGAGYGRFRMFGSVGYMVGLYILALVVQGVDRLLLIAGIVMILGVIPLLLANVQTSRHVERHGVGVLLRRKRLLRFLVAVFFFSFGGPAAFTFLALYAKQLGMDQASVGRLLGMCGVMAVVALPLMGSLADRVGPKWILTLAFIAMPVRVLIQSVTVSGVGLYLAQCFHFFTWAGPEVVVYVYVTRLVGEQDKGVAISAYLTTRTIAGIVANPLIGFLAEHAGFRPMFGIVACISAVGLALFWSLEHGRGERQ